MNGTGWPEFSVLRIKKKKAFDDSLTRYRKCEQRKVEPKLAIWLLFLDSLCLIENTFCSKVAYISLAFHLMIKYTFQHFALKIEYFLTFHAMTKYFAAFNSNIIYLFTITRIIKRFNSKCKYF